MQNAKTELCSTYQYSQRSFSTTAKVKNETAVWLFFLNHPFVWVFLNVILCNLKRTSFQGAPSSQNSSPVYWTQWCAIVKFLICSEVCSPKDGTNSFVISFDCLHATAREAEMRQLRKTNMEYEERNAALQKHVESMRGAVERLEGDVMQERGRNSLLQQHLETLRQALTSSFSSVPLPCENKLLVS